tara:strand:- start:8248 stop:9477 length:1230 start_codon:yes stop_codon:yes gene_type:complete
MKKTIGAAFLVAGTCIGSGMMALPLVLGKIGILPSFFLMLITWLLMYYTALFSIELNLQAGRGLSLGSLGRIFSGFTAEVIGVVSLKLLSYALLAVYISGLASVFDKLFDMGLSIQTLITLIALGIFLVLCLPLKILDIFNRFLFITLLVIFLILIASLFLNIDKSSLPLFGPEVLNPLAFSEVIPIVFTSFGFQVIFHTLANYCNKDKRILKKAFFYGSLIPAIVYMIWAISILSILYKQDILFYNAMISGSITVGELVEKLSNIAQMPYLDHVVWVLSCFAIVTSLIGVGIGLYDSFFNHFEDHFSKYDYGSWINKLVSSLITVLPAYLVVVLIPKTFIAVLGFAGMILVVIAIFLPAFLLIKVKKFSMPNIKYLYYKELKSDFLINLSIVLGIIVVVCEVVNLIFS